MSSRDSPPVVFGVQERKCSQDMEGVGIERPKHCKWKLGQEEEKEEEKEEDGWSTEGSQEGNLGASIAKELWATKETEDTSKWGAGWESLINGQLSCSSSSVHCLHSVLVSSTSLTAPGLGEWFSMSCFYLLWVCKVSLLCECCCELFILKTQ